MTALRLLITDILTKLATGETITLETYQKIEAEVKNRKSSRGLELVKEWQKRGKSPEHPWRKYPPLQRPSRRFAR